MAQPIHSVRFSFADYVAFERTSNVKHEYWAGQIYAMAGGTPEHAALAASVSGLLFAQLQSSVCRLYSSDLRVRAGDLVTYPDVSVVCGPPERDALDSSTALNPTVVVEVTSPSTELYDRTEKLERYQQISSLQAIVIVSHAEPRIECWTRSSVGWDHVMATQTGRVELGVISAALVVSEVYSRAGFTVRPSSE